MAIEQSSSGKHIIYKDAVLKTSVPLTGYSGSSFLDAGYIYAPYVPIFATPVFMDVERIKEETRVPIKIIKVALKRAGYKINRDFTIETDPLSATIVINSRPGRRFNDYGQCRAATMRKGKLSITWTYDPGMGGKASKNVDVTLADPGCFQQIADAIVTAIKENQTNLTPGIISRYGYNKRNNNTSYYGTVKVTL
jgi:hypothetical protein